MIESDEDWVEYRAWAIWPHEVIAWVAEISAMLEANRMDPSNHKCHVQPVTRSHVDQIESVKAWCRIAEE